MQIRIIVLVVVSIVIAVLLASALASFTRVSDSALAHLSPSPSGEGRGEVSSRPSTAGKNYLPIIFLNSATAGGAWLLGGNAGTNWLTDFLGTTDQMTLTLRVSNTLAYRLVPAADPGRGFAPNLIGGPDENSIAPNLYGSTIAGGGVSGLPNVITGTGIYAFIGGGYLNTVSGVNATIGGGNFNNASGSYSTIGGGASNTASGYNAAIGGGRLITATGNYATISGGISNIASGYGATVSGGSSNIASNPDATIGGGNANIASGWYSTVGGGRVNSANNNDATIGGGNHNTASGVYATVSGGAYNTAGVDLATVAGGEYNTAIGFRATVGGGWQNTASGDVATIGGGQANTASAANATIGGGYNNVVSGTFASVGGGYRNTAGGPNATIPGGYLNSATMTNTFAAGCSARAVHPGSFVWSDGNCSAWNSTGNNQFLINATGGVGIGTNAPSSALHVAAPNARLRLESALTDTWTVTEYKTDWREWHTGVGGSGVQNNLDYKYYIYDATANQVRMVIDANGRVGIGTTNPGSTLEVNGVVRVDALGAAGATSLCINASNDLATCSSSLRYKDNVADLTRGLDAVAQLRPVTYNWKNTGQPDVGFVAEEVNRVMPQLTTLNSEGQIEGVKYDRVSALLVKGMQEQQAQIEDLQARNEKELRELTELKSEVAALKAQSPAGNALGGDWAQQAVPLQWAAIAILAVMLARRRL